jgi:hypothetical protein
MAWFTKVETKTVETIAQPSALERYERSCRQLSEIGREMKDAEKALVRFKDPRIAWKNAEMYARVNAMEMPLPELRECERRWAKLFQAHQQKQDEVQRLKKEAGLASY